MKRTRLQETAKTGNPEKERESSVSGSRFNDNYFIHEIEDDNSFKMPLILWLILAPFLGLFYGIYIPLVWLAKGLKFLVKSAGDAMISRAGDLSIFSWNPVKVYFLGRGEERRDSLNSNEEE